MPPHQNTVHMYKYAEDASFGHRELRIQGCHLGAVTQSNASLGVGGDASHLVLLVKIPEEFLLLAEQRIRLGTAVCSGGRRTRLLWSISLNAHQLAELGRHLPVLVLGKSHFFPHLGTCCRRFLLFS